MNIKPRHPPVPLPRLLCLVACMALTAVFSIAMEDLGSVFWDAQYGLFENSPYVVSDYVPAWLTPVLASARSRGLAPLVLSVVRFIFINNILLYLFPALLLLFLWLVHRLVTRRLPGYTARRLDAGATVFYIMTVPVLIVGLCLSFDMNGFFYSLLYPLDPNVFYLLGTVIEDYFFILFMPILIRSFFPRSPAFPVYAASIIAWVLAHPRQWSAPSLPWVAFAFLVFTLFVVMYRACGSLIPGSYAHFLMNMPVFTNRGRMLVPTLAILVFAVGYWRFRKADGMR